MSEFSRLRWLCRRGMKELDLVMTRYLDNHYATASLDEQALFKILLDMPDPDLYALLLGRSKASTRKLERFTQSMREMTARG